MESSGGLGLVPALWRSAASLMWRCRVWWHDPTPWSLPFLVTVGDLLKHELAYQNRRCQRCGLHQQRKCGWYTSDQRSQQFVRMERRFRR